MIHILLTGAISLSNKGTCAIVISTIETLKRIIPAAEITVELFYPDKQRDIYPLDTRHDVKLSAPLIEKPIYGVMVFAYSLIFSGIRKFFPKLNFVIPRQYANADIIVDISAEAFIKYYDDDTIQYTQRYLLHLYPLLLGILLGKKIVLFSQTLAPFGFFKPIMKFIIKRCVYISVRDETSINNLKKDNIDAHNIYLSADPAFFLNTYPKDKIDKILMSEGLDMNKIKNEGFTILGVTLAKTTGRTLNENEFRKMIDVVSGSLNLPISGHQLFIIFIPHSSGKIRANSNDVLAGYELEKAIINKSHLFVIKGDYSPQELKGLIRECDLLMSLRMHPVIAALSLGIPSILIAFNDKAYGLMRRFDMEKYVCNIKGLSENELHTKLEELIRVRLNSKKLIDIKRSYIEQLIRNDFENLNNIINMKYK